MVGGLCSQPEPKLPRGPFVGEDNHHNLEVDTVNFEKDKVLGDDNRKDLAVMNEGLVDPNLMDQ